VLLAISAMWFGKQLSQKNIQTSVWKEQDLQQLLVSLLQPKQLLKLGSEQTAEEQSRQLGSFAGSLSRKLKLLCSSTFSVTSSTVLLEQYKFVM
jgi:hypothetical protein